MLNENPVKGQNSQNEPREFFREDIDEKASQASFEQELAGMQFDEKAVADASYELLSNTKGYSLIRGEIVGKKDASADTFKEDQFAKYVEDQGGRKYLGEVFNRGRAKLFAGYLKSVKDFDNYMNLLESKDPKDQKKLENFKASPLGQKYLDFLATTEPENQTFASAIEAGLFNLNLDLETIVGYGLIHFEDQNRKQRIEVLKRRQASEEMDFLLKYWKTGKRPDGPDYEVPPYTGPADPRDAE
jgi:hypothetical protein